MQFQFKIQKREVFNEQGFQNLVDSIKREKEAQAQIPVEESQWQRNRNHRRAFDRLIKVWNEESATAYADSISNKLQTGSVDDWNKGMIEALLAKINELAGAEK
jgi:formate dehydrogenase maturation protein FdhE